MNCSFIHITDHHLAESETALIYGFSPGYAFRAALRHIAQHIGSRADFIVSTGDLVEKSSAVAYQALRQMLNVRDVPSPAPGPLLISLEGLQEFPMYLLSGNHDDRDNFFQCLFPQSPPMPLMRDEMVKRAIDSTEGFALVHAGLKAPVENQMILYLVADLSPAELPRD